ncbi:MAG: hypothetical protein QF681_07815 [Vicinamibacterales bacterium]|nr:hypothetical protein [Vicinamibacterales bacterium]
MPSIMRLEVVLRAVGLSAVVLVGLALFENHSLQRRRQKLGESVARLDMAAFLAMNDGGAWLDEPQLGESLQAYFDGDFSVQTLYCRLRDLREETSARRQQYLGPY